MSWVGLGSWWRDELETDPGYEEDVTPLILELLAPRPGDRYLDVGCGDGRLMRDVVTAGALIAGVDLDDQLLNLARAYGPVLRYQIPNLACIADAAFDGCVVSLVLEHVADHVTMLSELARVTSSGGVLALVANHPVYTAPGSAPIEEPDGETTWRPGRYFSHGFTDEPAGAGSVRFHHRSLGDLLTTAAMCGWDLQRLVERGPSEGQIRRHVPLAAQYHFPRLLGARWIKR